MSKELRDYQIKAIEAVDEALSRGVNRQIACMATGLGKTFTAVSICKNYKKVLWITHNQELIEQSALAFIKEYFDDSFAKEIESRGFINYIRNDGLFALNEFKMGMIKADVFNPNGNVVMASAPTLYRRLDRLNPEMFDLIIVDECHLACAKSWVTSLNFFTPKLLLGLTATPTRADGLQLGDVFDEIVYEYGIKEGVSNGYLAEIDAIRVKTTVSLDKVKTTAGEFNQRDLSNEINTPERNQLVVNNYLKYANGRQGIFFCVDVDHSIKLAEVFNDMGILCKAVSADEELTPNRSANIKAFKQGKIQILTNCMVLVAGFDYSEVGVIGMASPTKSLTKYLQAIGRGSRLKSADYVSKFGQNCIVLDIVDSTTRHNLVNAWELDKEKPLEDRTFTTQEKKDKILAERLKRKAVIEHERKEDERVSLLKIPKYIVNKSIKMQEEATEAQLKWLKDLGHDTDNQHFTKFHANEIISQLPANKNEVAEMRKLGYDVDSKNVITKQDYNAVKREIFNKLNKKSQPYQKR